MEYCTFYKSFYTAISDLPKDKQVELYSAIFSYFFDGIEPVLEGISKTVFILIKPQLDATKRSYDIGKKGGRPSQEKTGVSENKKRGFSKKNNPPFLKKITPLSENKKPPFLNLKNQEEDKEEDKEKKEEEEKKEDFRRFFDFYPGTKRSVDTEFSGLISKHGDWKNIIHLLETSIVQQISQRQSKEEQGGFVPNWKNMQTWINNRSWEENIKTNNNKPKGQWI